MARGKFKGAMGASYSRRVYDNKVYLTNVQLVHKELYQEAILKSGRTDIHIDNDPIPTGAMDALYNQYREVMIGKYFSVYRDEHSPNRNCSDFWKIVDDLKDDPSWKTYLALLQD